MKKTTWHLFLVLLLTACCKDNDDPLATQGHCGYLTVRVLSAGDTGFEGAAVFIYSADPVAQIFHDSTGNEGLCSAGKLLEGQYHVMTEALKEGKLYSAMKNCQVITGESLHLDLYPFENVGTLTVKLTDPESDPIANVNAALVPHPSVPGMDYTFDDLMGSSYFTGTSGDEGRLTFTEVPAGLQYSVLVYYSSTLWVYPLNILMHVNKDMESKYTVVVTF